MLVGLFETEEEFTEDRDRWSGEEKRGRTETNGVVKKRGGGQRQMEW